PELRVTPERDRRLAEQAGALQQTDAVRLLDLVAAALEATTNGAQARIQLELVLVKAAAPEVDPSVSALLARIERIEAGVRPVAVTERELELAFPPGAAFLKRKAEQDDHRRVAAEALRTVTGHSLALRYELLEAGGKHDEPPGAPTLSGEELVRRFLEEFDA